MVKRISFWAIALILIVSYQSYSQFYGGLHIGPNFANGSFSNADKPLIKPETKIGFLFGALADVKLFSNIYLQAEINYVQRGPYLAPAYFFDNGSTVYTHPVDGTKYDYSMDYIDLSFLLKYKLDPFKFYNNYKIAPYFFIGPTGGFLYSAQSKVIRPNPQPSDTTWNESDFFKPTTYFLDFGLGAESKINDRTYLYLQAKYSYGIENICKAPDVVLKLSGVQLQVGLKICLFDNLCTEKHKEEVYREEVKPNNNFVVYGTVKDAKTKQPLEASIAYSRSDGSSILSTTTNPANGQYRVTLPTGKEPILYSVHSDKHASAGGFIDVANIPNNAEIERNIELYSIEVGKTIRLNILFEFGKSTINPVSYPEIDRIVKFLNDNPKTQIEIGGHTDNVGTDDYNLKLSQNRAKSIADYIITKAVNSNRISYKGYGSTKPVTTNNTEEGRRENRRVEVIIK